MRALSTAFFVFYPIVIWAALQYGFFTFAVFLLALAVLVRASFSKKASDALLALIAFGLATSSYVSQSDIPVRFYPVAVNATFLAVFAGSLLTGTPIVERFARLKNPDLGSKEVTHCRRATLGWSVFFIVNGAIAFDSVINRSIEWWTIYNGVIAYILIAAMFATEFLFVYLAKHRT